MHPISASVSSFFAFAFMFAQCIADSSSESHQITKNKVRQIQFTNRITDDKKGYNLVITTFRPTKFKITINGQKLRDGSTITVPVENNVFKIRYDYEFKAMLKTFAGYREVEFEIDPIRDHYNIDFSWKHDNRFIINHAKFLRITLLYEPGSEHAR